MTDHEKSAVLADSDGSPDRPESRVSRTYEAPRLTYLGDVRTITMGTSPNAQDSGGVPGFGKKP
jgi:hypothetical protein